MKLTDYIKEHHNGVNLQFAQTNGMKRQQVEQCLSKGYYHAVNIEGDLMLVMAKRKLKEKSNGL